jgi:hypothetical protein
MGQRKLERLVAEAVDIGRLVKTGAGRKGDPAHLVRPDDE